MGRALFVAVGLAAVCSPVAAQQANWRRATQNDPAFALSLYEPEILNAKDSSLLFHKGRVQAWSDGGRLVSENALADIGLEPLDLFPVAYLTPNAFGPVPARKGRARDRDVACGSGLLRWRNRGFIWAMDGQRRRRSHAELYSGHGRQ